MGFGLRVKWGERHRGSQRERERDRKTERETGREEGGVRVRNKGVMRYAEKEGGKGEREKERERKRGREGRREKSYLTKTPPAT